MHTKIFSLLFHSCFLRTSEKTKLVKTWEKTSQQEFVRHKSGRYYARTFGNNKEVWKSLRTSHSSVAQAKLAEFLREHREKQVMQ